MTSGRYDRAFALMEPLVKPIEGVSAAQNRIFRRAEGRDDVETALKAGERIDDLQRDGLRIIQREDGFRFGTDAVLLHHGKTVAQGPVRDVLCPEHIDPVYDMDVAAWMRQLLAQWE